MKVEMVPIDAHLVAHGRCCNCKQTFEGDEFYCRVSTLTGLPVCVLVCIGCAALLTCHGAV